GIYDMSGNVNEWCWDWFGKIFYTDSPEKNPIGPQNGDRRIYRGENYGDRYVESSCKKRNFTAANYKKNNIGFRVVRSTK
ncbi:SUMF1/EgtB/PvdO family nonheme iron enzyme, partial [bacterium]|nr:SUMF1/EgtB/PvdO family nonheme iron enzyme [bacterium]